MGVGVGVLCVCDLCSNCFDTCPRPQSFFVPAGGAVQRHPQNVRHPREGRPLLHLLTLPRFWCGPLIQGLGEGLRQNRTLLNTRFLMMEAV